MNRLIYADLLKWKTSKSRKPLLLYGARQVGKTWLLEEFGKKEFETSFYINFDTDHTVHSAFKEDISPKIVIRNLENYFNRKIDPANTLLIFDEIQECQRAKDSLKYFNENAPQYFVAAAGSFLGIASGKFPVGQVNELTLYPLSFSEFLEATGNDMLAGTLREKSVLENLPLITASHDLLTGKLKDYFFTGGMPEAVKTFSETGSFAEVLGIQETILNNYKNDFLKHISAANIPKVNMLWDSIPVHLAREKKKFVYKDVKIGGRALEFENAMNWLTNTGLVYRVDRITDPKLPLSRSVEREFFKLYMLDTGLLTAKAKAGISGLVSGSNSIFSEFKGALTEQFVLQELKAAGGMPVFYWGNASGKAEVDFLIQYKNEVIPIEVKSSFNTKSQSLSVYTEKYNPKYAVRASLKNFGKSEGLISVPLYMIGMLKELIG